eukprot:gene12686-biopygen4958
MARRGRNKADRTGFMGETALPASGPRPARVRFFEFYRAARVRSAPAAVFFPVGVSCAFSRIKMVKSRTWDPRS